MFFVICLFASYSCLLLWKPALKTPKLALKRPNRNFKKYQKDQNLFLWGFRHFIGRWLFPKGPKIETFQSRLKISISLENFNPDLRPLLFGFCAISTPQRITVKFTKIIQKKPGGELICKHFGVNVTNGKKHPKKICIKNFGGTLAGGQGGGLGAQILYVGVGFPSRIQCIKNFEGGGSKGVLGVGSKVQFWGPISLCLCAFLGLERNSWPDNPYPLN